jgi:hypothetical protein
LNTWLSLVVLVAEDILVEAEVQEGFAPELHFQ